VRWSDEVFSAVRRVNIEGDLVLQLGLRIVYRGSIEFRDTSGARLDPSEIDSVTLTSGSGEAPTRAAPARRWPPSLSRPAPGAWSRS
jgi:hypothetical protein